MTSQLQQKMHDISAYDQRRTGKEFYQTFDLESYYSLSMINMIINGKRGAELELKKLLARCLNIYCQNTYDYSDVNGAMLTDLLNQWQHKTGAHITYATLAQFVARGERNIQESFEKHTATTNDVFDVLCYGFMDLKRTENSFTNTVDAYRELQRRLMRAEIGDGVHTRTIEEVSQETGIAVTDLKDLPSVCHDSKKFLQVYQALVNIQKPYVIVIEKK